MTAKEQPVSIEGHYTVPQVAKALQVDPRTVRSWIEKKILVAVRVGRQYRIPKSALDEMGVQVPENAPVPAPRPTSKREKKGVSG